MVALGGLIGILTGCGIGYGFIKYLFADKPIWNKTKEYREKEEDAAIGIITMILSLMLGVSLIILITLY